MKRYLDGDQRAFSQLHARHEPLVRRLIARGVARPADVDDLVQQTFTQLHARRASFRSGERLKPWLCAMARNVCRDHGRWRKRRLEVDCDVDLLLEDVVAHPSNESEQVGGSLVAALDALSEPTRRIFHQHFLEDRALVDIARELGTNPGTLRVRVHRGCRQLREALTDAGGQLPS